MKKNTKTAKTAKTAKKPTPNKMRERRQVLAALSQELKAKNPDEPTNSLLLRHYAAKLGSAVFDTFDGWTKRGRAVKKGERACAFWKPAGDGGKSRWLVEFLFAESQTTERNAKPAPVVATANTDAAPAVATA